MLAMMPLSVDGGLAAVAQAGDLDTVVLGFEVVGGGELDDEPLDTGGGNGNGAAAAGAGEVVMVAVELVGELNQALAGDDHVFNNVALAEQG